MPLRPPFPLPPTLIHKINTMHLKVLGSSSKGNCYLIYDDNEVLILECGIRMDEVKQALDFNLSDVVVCLLTHEHKDHSGFIKDFIRAGIDVFSSEKTFVALSLQSHHFHAVTHNIAFRVGNFRVLPFKVMHDAAEPLGFYISHPAMGNLLFLTDTFYSAYTFPHLNHILIECNYSVDIVNKNLAGSASLALRDRVLFAHMSLTTTLDFLRSNDLKQARNIMLIHLSDKNSDSKQFKNEVLGLPDVQPFTVVSVAAPGMTISLNKHTF